MWKTSSADAAFCFWIFYIFKLFLPTKYKKGGKSGNLFFLISKILMCPKRLSWLITSQLHLMQTDNYNVSAKYWSHCNNEEGMKSSISRLIHCISQFGFSFVPFNVAFFRTFMAYSCPLSTPLIFLTRNTWNHHYHHHHHRCLNTDVLFVASWGAARHRQSQQEVWKPQVWSSCRPIREQRRPSLTLTSFLTAAIRSY